MNGVSTFYRRWAAMEREGGFTLIEMLIVVVLVGIMSAMFAATLSAVITRSTAVQEQNTLQTSVRASLNQLVSDVRDASYGDTTVPIISYTSSSIAFYSPDRLGHMRRIKYWVGGTSADWYMYRQVTTSTNKNGPPGTGISSDTGPGETLFDSIRNPTTVFQYCTSTPRDMALSPTNPTSPQLITWQCTAPTDVSYLKTMVTQVAIAPIASSAPYYYGAVATLRWNVSSS